MQLEQSFDVASSPEVVWQWFHAIETLIECLPGASLRGPVESGQLPLSMVVKLGPITASFVGEGEVAFDEATRSGVVSGAAADRKSGSRIKGKVAFALSAVEAAAVPSTRVALIIDYTIGGALAQFSREGIVRDLAQRLTTAFAANLRSKLEAAGSGSSVTSSLADPTATNVESIAAFAPADPTVADRPRSAPSDPVTAQRPSPAPQRESARPPPALDLGTLLWAGFIARLRRWLHLRPRA